MKSLEAIREHSVQPHSTYGYHNALIWASTPYRPLEEVKSYLEANIQLKYRFPGQLPDVDGYIAALKWVLED